MRQLSPHEGMLLAVLGDDAAWRAPDAVHGPVLRQLVLPLELRADAVPVNILPCLFVGEGELIRRYADDWAVLLVQRQHVARERAAQALVDEGEARGAVQQRPREASEWVEEEVVYDSSGDGKKQLRQPRSSVKRRSETMDSRTWHRTVIAAVAASSAPRTCLSRSIVFWLDVRFPCVS